MYNVFLVSSCIKSRSNKEFHELRYQETLNTFKSIREKCDNTFIIFCDGSYEDLSEDQIKEISSKVDISLYLSQDEEVKNLFKYNNNSVETLLKSYGECFLLARALKALKENKEILEKTNRIFKLGGRCTLGSLFNISDYDGNFYGKYIFKKRRNTSDCNYVLETRLYSLCSSLIEEYIEVLHKNLIDIGGGADTEHAHFKNIDKNKLVEFETINCDCYVVGGKKFISE